MKVFSGAGTCSVRSKDTKEKVFLKASRHRDIWNLNHGRNWKGQIVYGMAK